jgi:hypothetical protein
MKKWILGFVLTIACVFPSFARKQWTEKEAWKWQERVGVVKGFNGMIPPYPGMTRDDVLRKAKEIGLNNVRFWIPGTTAEEKIANLKLIVDTAEKYGITCSPVLTMPFPKAFAASGGTDEGALKEMEVYTKKVIGAFAKDRRIIMWDLFNEPGCVNFFSAGDADFTLSLKAVEHFLEWSLEMNPVQALTSSIFWRGDLINNETPLHKYAREVESKMDVHNFHDYSAAGDSDHPQEYQRKLMDYLLGISNRPLVCTECLTRVNNSGLARTFADFQPYNVNFYLWGLYICDRNWAVRWERSTYDPYENPFHNLLRPDGDPIDFRDIELIRNYCFTNGKQVDPGAEYTDRWENQKAWRWMSPGPVKGRQFDSVADALAWLNTPEAETGFNSLNVKWNYNEYTSDKKGFYARTDSLLRMADARGMTVLPTLLSDADLTAADKELAQYVGHVIRHYYQDDRIQAWDLYYQPGAVSRDTERLNDLLKMLFRYGRYEWPNQPMMATPVVRVQEFAPDFDYRRALFHGTTNGWNRLEYQGGANADLCYLAWKLSDVIAFASNQTAPQTGWLKSVAFRYGRPVFVTNWQPTDDANAAETLDNFSRSHTFWYQSGRTATLRNIGNFKFKPITVGH